MCVVCVIRLEMIVFLHGAASSYPIRVAIHLVVILRIILTYQLVP